MPAERSDHDPRDVPAHGRSHSLDTPTRSAAFAPGRVNLIGEHTDYNEGLALPFAIAEGITVTAVRSPRRDSEDEHIRAYARDLHERDQFALAHPPPASGWRAYVRGVVAELLLAGRPLVGASLDISGGPPPGAGLSSSAALEVALCLALDDLATRVARSRPGRRARSRPGRRARSRPGSRARSRPGSRTGSRAGDSDDSGGLPRPPLSRIDVARLCARVENDWVGAHTGLLDQLASLYGAADTALCIDFRSLRVEPVPLLLRDWRLVVLDSGDSHLHSSSGYNQRRDECARACELLGVRSLRDAEADTRALAQLPEPLRRRALHVTSENQRVRDAVAALRAGDLPALGQLLDASHRSLREHFQVSTPAVEAAVQRLRDAGSSGARLVGGGFGGSVLGLFAPGIAHPLDARQVRPSPGAHVLEP